MLKRRPTDRFKVVSIHDEALLSLGDSVIRDYADSGREFSVIEPHLSAMADPPTVFICEPLRPAYDGIAIEGDASGWRQVFAAHVKDVVGVDDSMKPQLTRDGEHTYLPMDYVDTIPPQWVIDVAQAIIRRGMADTSPFSLPAGYWRRRNLLTTMRRAARALTSAPTGETASGDSGSNAPSKSHTNET